MGNDIVAYDYCSFILLLITVFYYSRTTVRGTNRVRIMSIIVVCTMAAALCDATRVRFAGLDVVSEFRFINVNFAYFLFLSVIPPLYLLYVLATTDMWHKLTLIWVKVILCALPELIYIPVLVINYFRPIAFEVVNDNGKTLVYHWGYYLGHFVFIIYIAVIFFFIKNNVRSIDMKRYLVLLVPTSMVTAGMLISWAVPKHHIVCFVITICILTLVLVNKRVEDSIDPVTGMHTYKVFAEDMGTNFKSGKQMEIILINIVNFKYALRMVGYDAMLSMMSPVSAEILRIMKNYHAQFMCYYNGDGKFAIELSRKHFPFANEIADEIRRAIMSNIRMDISDFELEINTCLVLCPDDISDVNSLFMLISDLDRTTVAKNVVSASSITGTDDFKMKKEMSAIIERALTNHYFSVFYQPIYDTKSKKFMSAEALLRLRDPKYGYISPDMFIPIAEKNGAIHSIGSFVLEEVVKFIASPDFEGLGVEYIEINLSAMQCLRSDLAEEIISLCHKYNVEPSKINLEITETASAYSQAKLYGNISTLAEHGFTFSLDDFGTGYSNLMRIASLPLDIVKLDRAFVLMEESGGHHVIIRNLIEMLKSMKMKVVVEGIETEEMLESFKKMGVDEVQGFYFSRPLTKQAYIRFVKESTCA